MGSDTEAGSTELSDPLDPDVIGEAIEERLRSRISSGSGTLTPDVPATLSARPRVRGQWLVLGAQTGAAERDAVDVLPAATSVELVYAHALANAEAMTSTDAVDRDDALLTSDYLHSLAYAALGDVSSESPVVAACFESFSRTSQRLASLWTRLEEAQSVDAPDLAAFEPIVMGAAGDLAGLLGGTTSKGRSALRTAGAALGIARWHRDRPRPTDEATAIVAETAPIERASIDVGRSSDGTVKALLEPVAETPAGETLRSFARTLRTGPLDRRAVTHE